MSNELANLTQAIDAIVARGARRCVVVIATARLKVAVADALLKRGDDVGDIADSAIAWERLRWDSKPEMSWLLTTFTALPAHLASLREYAPDGLVLDAHDDAFHHGLPQEIQEAASSLMEEVPHKIQLSKMPMTECRLEGVLLQDILKGPSKLELLRRDIAAGGMRGPV